MAAPIARRTPFKALATGEFIEEQIFNWTYTDEQRAKAAFAADHPGQRNPYGALPQMRLLTYQMPDELLAVASGGEFDEFDLNAFFVPSQHKATAGKATAVDRLRIVAKGGKRYVWRILDFRGSAFALKMHRYRENRRDDFGPMTIELQRRDALLHEMTASSPYIVNIYGYCGASAFFDFGDGGQLETNVKKYGAFVGPELLEIAHRVAESVADVQQSDHFGEPTVAHADIYGSQWVMVRGRYMLTDFNLAKLLKRSKQQNATVPFRREVIDNVCDTISFVVCI